MLVSAHGTSGSVEQVEGKFSTSGSSGYGTSALSGTQVQVVGTSGTSGSGVKGGGVMEHLARWYEWYEWNAGTRFGTHQVRWNIWSNGSVEQVEIVVLQQVEVQASGTGSSGTSGSSGDGDGNFVTTLYFRDKYQYEIGFVYKLTMAQNGTIYICE